MKIITAHLPPYRRIRAEAFWDRFTAGEIVDYEIAMQHQPADTNAAKKTAAKLRIFMREVWQKGFVNPGRTKTRDFVIGLEGTVLTAGRALVILDAEITAGEAYIVPGELG